MRSTFIDFADEKDRLWKVLGRIRKKGRELGDPCCPSGGILHLEGGHQRDGPDAGIWQGGRDAVLLRQAGQARAVCLQRGLQDQRRLQRGGEHPEEGVPGHVGRNGGFPVPGVSGDGRLEGTPARAARVKDHHRYSGGRAVQDPDG